LQVQGIALQPGASLPQTQLAIAQQPLPGDLIRTTLYYGVEWGYSQSDPQQVALALWYARSGQWQSDNHNIAQRIADAAASSPGLPTWLADGRAIPGLAAAGQLVVDGLSLSTGGLSPAAGGGTLVIRNTSAQDLLVHLPYG